MILNKFPLSHPLWAQAEKNIHDIEPHLEKYSKSILKQYNKLLAEEGVDYT
jgi:hypothetical protein